MRTVNGLAKGTSSTFKVNSMWHVAYDMLASLAVVDRVTKYIKEIAMEIE